MKLAIADPPYLGRAAMYYSDKRVHFGQARPAGRPKGGRTGRSTTTPHAEAHKWDEPDSHAELVRALVDGYDGWAIAMNPENLEHYMTWVPRGTRVCSWVKPDAFPNARIVKSWEPVLLWVPEERRRTFGETQVRDSLVAPKATGVSGAFTGAKPRAWTRWVLDMLGYDQEQDTVDDLFGGSGAVAAEIAQGTLL